MDGNVFLVKKKDIMVRAYIGADDVPVGSGKTSSMIRDARLFVFKNHDRMKYKIVSNLDFEVKERVGFRRKLVDYKPHIVQDKSEFLKLLETETSTLFILDEAGIWLNKYDWSKIGDTLFKKLVNTRKFDIHLFYTAQLFNTVVKDLRSFTNPVIECTPYPKPPIDRLTPPPTPIFTTQIFRPPTYYDSKSQIAGNKDAERSFIKKRKFVFRFEFSSTYKAYDTKKVIK